VARAQRVEHPARPARDPVRNDHGRESTYP
jgi:hypothetical protein